MYRVFQIFISDIRKLLRNRVALIIVGGLLVLPSLYAWFNIYASWDPYGNTGGIKVAICNEDLGGKMKDIDINIGKEVSDNLRENHNLGWTFVENRDEAIDLVERGKVYASIIIPKDFSEKMSTVLDDNPMKPSLEYYVNEKINAISPKITDKGATTIQSEISTAFVETVTKQVFEVLNKLGIQVEDLSPVVDVYKDRVSGLIEKIPIVIDRLNSNAELLESGSDITEMSQEDINLIKPVLEDLISFTGEFKKDLDKVNGNTEELSRDTVETLGLIKTSLEDLDKNIMNLKENVLTGKPELINEIKTSSENLSTISSDIKEIRSTLEQYNDLISPEINTLLNTLEEQSIELQGLLEKIGYANVDTSSLDNLTTSINKLNTEININLRTLNSDIEKELTKVTAQYNDIHEINKNLDKLIQSIGDKKELSEDEKYICDSILMIVQDLRKEIGESKSPLISDLDTIETNIKNLKANSEFDNSLAALKEESKKFKIKEKTYEVLKSSLKTSSNKINSIMGLLDTVSSTATEVNRNMHKVINDTQYYAREVARGIEKVRNSLNKINELLKEETNYIVPFIKEITDISLSRIDDMSNMLNNLSENIADDNNLETALDNMHNLNTNIISNIDSLMLKINTDLTSTIKRYLSSTSKFSSDVNGILSSINSKTETFSNFLNKLSDNGQVASEDLRNISKDLPAVQENLKTINNKINEVSEKLNLDDIMNKISSNKDSIADFMAYPVNLDTHALYHTDNYGSSMTPFYTTLSLWVGVLVLGSLLTTESKNTDFEPTPLQTHLGKLMLFASLAVVQGLIVSLGDIFLLKVSVADKGLFISLSMFLSLVFCVIVYTLISLFGNVGKAMGVILLVLQVAGSGGTFPIQMTPEFFQKLYSWLPFTYGIGALREAIAGVYFPSLKNDVFVLILYMAVFFAIGVLLVSKTYKYLKKFSHKLEESGIVE